MCPLILKVVFDFKLHKMGSFLGVQQLRLCAFTAGDKGSSPDQGTKIPQAAWYGKKILEDASPDMTSGQWLPDSLQ